MHDASKKKVSEAVDAAIRKWEQDHPNMTPPPWMPAMIEAALLGVYPLAYAQALDDTAQRIVDSTKREFLVTAAWGERFAAVLRLTARHVRAGAQINTPTRSRRNRVRNWFRLNKKGIR